MRSGWRDSNPRRDLLVGGLERRLSTKSHPALLSEWQTILCSRLFSCRVSLGVAIVWVGAVVVTIVAKRLHPFQRSIVAFARPRREALVALGIVLVQVAFITLVFAVLNASRPPTAVAPLVEAARYDLARLVAQLALLAVAFAPVLIVLLVRHQAPRTVGLASRDVIAQLSLGLVLGGLALVALGKATRLSAVELPEALRLIAYLGVGLEEEVTFRGFLQTRLVAWLGQTRGWLSAGGILHELTKCELVCANCHTIRTFRRNGWGTWSLHEAGAAYGETWTQTAA